MCTSVPDTPASSPELLGGQCPATPQPITIINGNKYLREADVDAKVLGGLEISRHYNGLGGYSTLMVGSNWSLNIDRSLSPYGTDKITALRGDGKQTGFTLSGGQFRPNAGGADVITPVVEAGVASGWRYTHAATREVERYDTNGRLLSITNAQGLVWSLIRDSAGRVVEIDSNLGTKVALVYAANYRLASLALADGSQIAYGYDLIGNLTSVTYPDGKSRIYGYNEAGQTGGASLPNALTSITDENGTRYIAYTYDSTGRAVSEVLSGNVGSYALTYNTGNTVVTDPLGTSRTYSYQGVLGVARSTGQSQPGGSGCGASSSALSYDANGNVASRTDFAGHTTTYSYDLNRNLELTRTEGSGTAVARTISTAWHPDWRLETRRAEPKKITTWIYNGQPDPTAGGATASCAPADALLPDGKPIAVLCKKVEQATTDATGASGFTAATSGTARTWAWTHNQYGQILTADGPRTDVSDVTTYTYYDATDAEIGRRGKLASITNALGQVTQFTSYDLNGRIKSITDPNGTYTDFTYDLRGRLISKAVGGETTYYSYDPAGQLSQVTLPDGTSLSYTYDAAHRLTAITDGNGNRIQYTLDAAGNRTKEEVLDPEGALAQTRNQVFDALGRLHKVIGAQNQTTTYAYDANGNLTGITDPLNHTTLQGFDALDRLVQITDPGNGQTQFAYDGQDRLTQVTDPRNLVTGYTIDGLGNRTGQQSPDTGATSQSFDAAGNLLTKTDAKNQVTQYQYDALNRLVQVTLADGGKQAYTWDTGENGIGRLSRIAELNAAAQETGRTEYGYDALGRLLTETRTIGGHAYVTAYAYADGRLASMTYPSGRLIEYAYDSGGKVNLIKTTAPGGSTQTVVSNVAYQPFGTVKSFTYRNGQTYTRSIDQDGRIAGYTLAGQAKLLGYDDASRITSITDAAVPADFVSYGYDALDRLTGAGLPYKSYSYGYDATGNRSSKGYGATQIPYVINAGSNRIDAINGSPPRSFSHDANGSITNDGKNQYGYDVRGRLKQTISVLGTTGYEVNAQGERVRKTGPNGDRIYHYDRQGRLIGEGTALGQIDREYIYLHDLPVAVIVE